MTPDNATFPLSKVKAYRAYFAECRAAAKAAKGSPEFNDLDVTVKLCDQLVELMTEREPEHEPKAHRRSALPAS